MVPWSWHYHRNQSANILSECFTFMRRRREWGTMVAVARVDVHCGALVGCVLRRNAYDIVSDKIDNVWLCYALLKRVRIPLSVLPAVRPKCFTDRSPMCCANHGCITWWGGEVRVWSEAFTCPTRSTSHLRRPRQGWGGAGVVVDHGCHEWGGCLHGPPRLPS